jgi:hypothetical protein
MIIWTSDTFATLIYAVWWLYASCGWIFCRDSYFLNMLPKVSQCTARFVYILSPPAIHQLRRNLYHVHLHYCSFQMRYNKTYLMQTAIAPMRVKDKITKHWDTFASQCIYNIFFSFFRLFPFFWHFLLLRLLLFLWQWLLK